MKKVHLFAIAFLVGITAQATINTEHSSATPLGNLNRYLNSQSVTFVEDGVMYEVFLNGSFQFDLPHYQTIYRGKKAKRQKGQKQRGLVINQGNRRLINKRIFKDRYGVIQAIGNTNLTYNRYGRVTRIGSVKLRHDQGKLRAVGGMIIVYNHLGRVSHTLGHINPQNRTYGVCGVGLATQYELQYDRRNRLITPRRYSGLNLVTGNHIVQNDYNDDWNDDWNENRNYYNDDDDDDDDDDYVRVGRRVRH